MRIQMRSVKATITPGPIRMLHFRFWKILAYSVPVAVFLVSLLLPLSDILRQMLVGVMLVWLYVGAMTGFTFTG